VALADTRITSGNEVITAKKVKLYQRGPKTSFFLMTSGLRSVRDKSLTYFEEALDKEGKKFDRLFKVLNCLAQQVRRVAAEDRRALEEAGLHFNIHALVGGQLAGDKEHKLYLLYPQGNWVEIGEGTPYQIIGAAPYGKPVLDRTLKHGDPIPFALKVGSLAFDSTRISAADVDFPVDVVVYRKGSFRMLEKRFTKDDMAENADGWQTRLRDSVNKMPSSWFDGIFPKEVADARAAKPSAEPKLPARAKPVPEQGTPPASKKPKPQSKSKRRAGSKSGKGNPRRRRAKP
jgi:putative proteasome-type protease